YPAEPGPIESSRTAPASQWPTAPAYLGPDQMAVGPQYPVFPGPETQGLAQKQKPAIVVVALLLFFLFVAVAAASLITYQFVYRDSSSGHTPVADNIPPPPLPPGLPGHPEIPVPPGHPAPPGGGSGTAPTALDSLIYPDSEQSVNVHGEGEGTIIMS